MKELKVRLTFLEEILGTASAAPKFTKRLLLRMHQTHQQEKKRLKQSELKKWLRNP